MKGELTFTKLAGSIRDLHYELTTQAIRAVNVSLTLRNWLIGLHIIEYEQNGADRARYGEALLDKLASELDSLGVTRVQARELRRYRLLYTVYPQIRDTLTPEFGKRIRLPANLGVSHPQIASKSSRQWAYSPSDLIHKLYKLMIF